MVHSRPDMLFSANPLVLSQRRSLRRVFATALVATAGLACQTYDFEPVTPRALRHDGVNLPVTAQNLAPDMMLVIDRSTSMKSRDSSAQSRMDQLKDTMQTFLTVYGYEARFGMVAFDSPNSTTECVPPSLSDITTTGVDIPDTSDPTALQANATQINTVIKSLTPNGVGTPTAGTLAVMADYPPLLKQDLFQKYVVLLTDGLPNCNANNPNNQCTAPNAACQCVLAGGLCNSDFTCARGCLDLDSSVSAVQSLHDKGVQTIVVGFGADTATGPASAALNAMAQAGGFARTCTSDAECQAQGDTTDSCQASGLCQKSFYQATNGDALGKVLQDIIIRSKDPCKYLISTEVSDPNTVSVSLNGTNIARGTDTWQVVETTDPQSGVSNLYVVFADTGAACAQLKASTIANPVQLSIQVVNPL